MGKPILTSAVKKNKTVNVNENLINPSIDSLLEKVENKYILALLSAKRARELFSGEESLIEEEFINKVTTAIHEIEDGKVTYIHDDEESDEEDDLLIEELEDDEL
jgi:DNA-directed RNA polymerase subunit omega